MQCRLTFAIACDCSMELKDFPHLNMHVHACDIRNKTESAFQKVQKGELDCEINFKDQLCGEVVNNKTLRGRINSYETLPEQIGTDETLCDKISNKGNSMLLGNTSHKESMFGHIINRETLFAQINNSKMMIKEPLIGQINSYSKVINKDTTCLICLKTYKTSGSLRCHLRYEHLPVTKRFTCKYCGDTFTRPWSCSRHERKQHK